MGSPLYILQSVRGELVEKEEKDTTGLESLLEGDQESYLLSARPSSKKAIGSGEYCIYFTSGTTLYHVHVNRY